jgi:hypothetical protein
VEKGVCGFLVTFVFNVMVSRCVALLAKYLVLYAIPGNTDNAIPVGAGLLAMDSSAPRLSSSRALSLTTIAGKPAPTKDRVRVENEVTSNPVRSPKIFARMCVEIDSRGKEAALFFYE